MAIRIACPNCQRLLAVPESAVGKQGQCKNCGSTFTIPPQRVADGQDVPAPAPAPPKAVKVEMECPHCGVVVRGLPEVFTQPIACPDCKVTDFFEPASSAERPFWKKAPFLAGAGAAVLLILAFASYALFAKRTGGNSDGPAATKAPTSEPARNGQDEAKAGTVARKADAAANAKKQDGNDGFASAKTPEPARTGQDEAKATTAVAKRPATPKQKPAAAEVAPLPPPPPLPEALLTWKGAQEYDVARIRQALLQWPAGQVSPAMMFAILYSPDGSHAKPPTGETKEWLAAALKVARPRALQALQRELEVAVGRLDLRGAVLVQRIAELLSPAGLPEASGALSRLREGYLTESDELPEFWRIEAPTVRRLAADIEQGQQPWGRISVRAKPGSHLVRVKARVTCSAPRSDPEHYLWSLGHAYLMLSVIGGDKPKDPAKPYCYISQEHVFLVTPDGDWLRCVYVDEDCATVRGQGTIMYREDVRFVGSLVNAGTTFDLSAVFAVPDSVKQYTFVLLGARPQSLSER